MSLTDIFAGILGFFAEVGRQLGFVGAVMALLAITCMGAVMRFVDRCLSVWDKAERRWRRWPTPVRHFCLLLGGLFLFFALAPAIPWTPALVALAFGLAAAWWVQGIQYARRYEVRSGPLAAWKYHLDSRSKALKLGGATEAATGKKNGKARSVRTTATGESAVMEPPDGMSTNDYAAEVNAGKHTAAIARRFGWDQVRAVTAMPHRDGTVLLRIDRTPPPDLLVEGETWTIPS